MQSFLINSTRESLNTFYNFLITELWKAKPFTILIAGLSHKASIYVWVEWTSDFENVEHLQHMTSNNWCLDNWHLEVRHLEVRHLNVPLLMSVILTSVILTSIILKTIFLKTVFLMSHLELPTLSMQYLNISHLGVWLPKAPECPSLDTVAATEWHKFCVGSHRGQWGASSAKWVMRPT